MAFDRNASKTRTHRRQPEKKVTFYICTFYKSFAKRQKIWHSIGAASKSAHFVDSLKKSYIVHLHVLQELRQASQNLAFNRSSVKKCTHRRQPEKKVTLYICTFYQRSAKRRKVFQLYRNASKTCTFFQTTRTKDYTVHRMSINEFFFV